MTNWDEVARLTAENVRLRHALQTVMQCLGPNGVPKNPDIDYGDPANLAGIAAEVDEALRACRSVGIEYQHRRGRL